MLPRRTLHPHSPSPQGCPVLPPWMPRRWRLVLVRPPQVVPVLPLTHKLLLPVFPTVRPYRTHMLPPVLPHPRSR